METMLAKIKMAAAALCVVAAGTGGTAAAAEVAKALDLK